jgi:hypothetical protein
MLLMMLMRKEVVRERIEGQLGEGRSSEDQREEVDSNEDQRVLREDAWNGNWTILPGCR